MSSVAYYDPVRKKTWLRNKGDCRVKAYLIPVTQILSFMFHLSSAFLSLAAKSNLLGKHYEDPVDETPADKFGIRDGAIPVSDVCSYNFLLL